MSAGADPGLDGSDQNGDGFERRMVTRATLLSALAEVPRGVLHATSSAVQVADAILAALPFAEPLTEPEARWMVTVGTEVLARQAAVAGCEPDTYAPGPAIVTAVNVTRAEAPASGLLSLAEALDRRADRIGDHGLTRDGSIRARVLREAAGMARRRAQGGQESAPEAAPVPADTGPAGRDASDAAHEALAASMPGEWVTAAEGWYSMHGAGLVRNLIAGAAPLIAADALERLATEFDEFAEPEFRDAARMARERAQAARTASDSARTGQGDAGGGQDATEALSGSALIAAERQRQIIAEGYTASHDAEHDSGELASAAACYALPEGGRPSSPGLRAPSIWPWAVRYWKPAPGDRVRELVKAGALIAAEIDRLTAAQDDDSDLTEDGWPL